MAGEVAMADFKQVRFVKKLGYSSRRPRRSFNKGTKAFRPRDISGANPVCVISRALIQDVRRRNNITRRKENNRNAKTPEEAFVRYKIHV